jgi:hypothetical protein
MIDWRVTPSRPASRSSESTIHAGKSTFTGFSDDDLVKAIVKRAADKDYSVREFIHSVVQSRAFPRRRNAWSASGSAMA